MVLKLKTPWRDGTTHQGTPPLEFMQRLAARAIEERPSVARAAAHLAGRAGPVARPLAKHKQSTGLFVSGLGLHLIGFHGVLAPNAKMRAQVVPQAPVEPADAAQPGRVRGKLCTSQAGADELGPAAQTGL